MSKKFRDLAHRYKEQKNKGSAMIVVIMAMAFIGILASVLMYMSLLNYQMKVNNLKAKDNFYSAETVLDEIRVGMQGRVSESIGEAYQNILLNYDSASMEEKMVNLRYGFLSQMQKYYGIKLGSGSMVQDVYNPVVMFGYLSDDMAEHTTLTVTYEVSDGKKIDYCVYRNKKDGKIVGGRVGGDMHTYTFDTDGNVVYDPGLLLDDIPHGNTKLYTDGLAYRNLKVTYTDASGYVSVIRTDLRVKMPDMEFAQSVSLPALTSFSLIANDTLQVLPANVNNEIAGSFYAKKMIVGSKVAGEGYNVSLALKEVSDKQANAGKRMVVEEELYVGQGADLSTDKYGELWAGTILMHGGVNSGKSTVNFAGNDIYVSGDLTISGEKNVFRAGALDGEEYIGKYVGFGNGQGDSDSSAIVVNGKETELDLSKLKNLSLAGNTYIALSKTDDQLTNTDIYHNDAANKQDVLMGQSIAVKSDQLAYLVPPACIGIKDGKSVLGQASNPMTLEQYRDYIDKKGVTKVDVNVACRELGGHDLEDYGIDENHIRTYYKRINSKITLVYFYVAFDKDSDIARQQANNYFQDYYNVNKSTMDAYANLYTNDIQIRDEAAGAYIMHLAGNVVQTSDDGRTLRSATLTSDKVNDGYQSLLAADRTKFQALCKKMLDVYEQLSSAEKERTIFKNLVDDGKIVEYESVLNADTTLTPQQRVDARYFGEPDAEDKALIIQGDYIYTGNGQDKFDGLIIATGNVTVNKSFNGTILAGGNITLGETLGEMVKVQPDREAVLHVLTYTAQAGSNEYHVTDFLRGGEGYLRGDSKVYSESDINLGDLIVYENWQKQ